MNMMILEFQYVFHIKSTLENNWYFRCQTTHWTFKKKLCSKDTKKLVLPYWRQFLFLEEGLYEQRPIHFRNE